MRRKAQRRICIFIFDDYYEPLLKNPKDRKERNKRHKRESPKKPLSVNSCALYLYASADYDAAAEVGRKMWHPVKREPDA